MGSGDTGDKLKYLPEERGKFKDYLDVCHADGWNIQVQTLEHTQKLKKISQLNKFCKK